MLYSVEKGYEYPMGYSRKVVWRLLNEIGEIVWFFNTRKMANLAVEMIESGKIDNHGDIESRMISWFNINGLDIPIGL